MQYAIRWLSRARYIHKFAAGSVVQVDHLRPAHTDFSATGRITIITMAAHGRFQAPPPGIDAHRDGWH